jgi:hypothetical protein
VRARLQKAQLMKNSSQVQNNLIITICSCEAKGRYAIWRSTPTLLSGETTMTRNIVALAAALGVSGLFFAAVLA